MTKSQTAKFNDRMAVDTDGVNRTMCANSAHIVRDIIDIAAALSNTLERMCDHLNARDRNCADIMVDAKMVMELLHYIDDYTVLLPDAMANIAADY